MRFRNTASVPFEFDRSPQQIGITVEKHAGEVASLRALPSDLRTMAFFNCWTRKEAYIKARGEGLSHPLDRFTVSIIPGQPARLLTADDPAEPSRWTLMDLSAGTGYVASLAVEGRVRTLRQWQWHDNAKA